MEAVADLIRRNSRRFSKSYPLINSSTSKPIPRQTSMKDSRLSIKLGDTVMVYDKQWVRESDLMESKLKEVEERNGDLQVENSILSFKLSLAMDMLAVAKLDLITLSLNGN